MKGFAICGCVLGLLMAAPAQAEVNCPIGLYVGGKLGMSVERFGDGIFGMNAASYSDPGGDEYSWGHHKIGLGGNRDTVFSGGVNIGYDFGKRGYVPIRVELDYTLRGNATDNLRKTGIFDVKVNDVPMPFDSVVDVKTDIRLQTAMLNAWYDIPTGTAFTPYVGGGLGVAFIRHKSTATENPGAADEERIHASKNFSNFAWSLGGGLAYNINDNWALDLGYRYIDAGDHKMSYQGEGGSYLYSKIDKIESHDIMLGVRYAF